MTRPAYPRTRDVARLIDAARTAGLDVGGVRFGADGSIVILTVSAAVASADEWGDVLDGRAA